MYERIWKGLICLYRAAMKLQLGVSFENQLQLKQLLWIFFFCHISVLIFINLKIFKSKSLCSEMFQSSSWYCGEVIQTFCTAWCLWNIQYSSDPHYFLKWVTRNFWRTQYLIVSVPAVTQCIGLIFSTLHYFLCQVWGRDFFMWRWKHLATSYLLL